MVVTPRPLCLQAWMLSLLVDVSALGIPIFWNAAYVRGLVVCAFLVTALFAAGGLYRPRLHLSALDDLPRLLGRQLIAVAAVATVIALRHDRMAVDGFLRVSAVIILLVLTGRFCTSWAIGMVRRRRWVSHRTVLVGAGQVGAELTRLLDRYPQYGLHVVGFVDTGKSADAATRTLPRLGDVDDVKGALERNNASTLIIADPDVSDTRLTDIMREAMDKTHDVFVVPRLHHLQTQTGVPDHIGAIPVMRIRPPLLSGWQRSLKRTIDVMVSVLGMITLAPIFVLCALGVRLESGPGVLFRQERVGRNGKSFEILKFRSLRPVNEAESRTNWSVASDNRVGPVGKFLRRTSLDEIPQLWNIFRGDMTLVGPRPERPFFVEQFSSEYRGYEWRHRVPAGLTGLAQVSGLRGDTPIADRARFDNYYIENWSLWLDFKIVIRTLHEVLAAGGR
ncbi:sugar transferase [Actinoplanes sp. NPDC049548]|uniref:sugar transferase n=1 Tax=Actinoplanes sp. NPDC049548 TaxID=3155152 RepID=UPI00344AF50C